MRTLNYAFNGVETTTSYAKAQDYAKKYGTTPETFLRDIAEPAPVLSPIRKAMVEQFGYVSAKFKDKVVLN